MRQKEKKKRRRRVRDVEHEGDSSEITLNELSTTTVQDVILEVQQQRRHTRKQTYFSICEH